uniref:Uncharacterized protein n=1 Tax=Odontella aurita TaxID=265563 RepID=A0A7S4JSY3_9STRA|mmetsp:Transcript_53541/g.160231  ORF Transcript_53541/g.160231 Transcript_53541/m.160231 type:complete len:304 (+) Transcript_53541:833-1744(+)
MSSMRGIERIVGRGASKYDGNNEEAAMTRDEVERGCWTNLPSGASRGPSSFVSASLAVITSRARRSKERMGGRDCNDFKRMPPMAKLSMPPSIASSAVPVRIVRSHCIQGQKFKEGERCQKCDDHDEYETDARVRRRCPITSRPAEWRRRKIAILFGTSAPPYWKKECHPLLVRLHERRPSRSETRLPAKELASERGGRGIISLEVRLFSTSRSTKNMDLTHLLMPNAARRWTNLRPDSKDRNETLILCFSIEHSYRIEGQSSKNERGQKCDNMMKMAIDAMRCDAIYRMPVLEKIFGCSCAQ